MSGPTSLDAIFADHMSRADACRCGNTEPPRAAAPVAGGWMTSYLCTDCGQAWTRDWKDA